jgi:hypothetical protein
MWSGFDKYINFFTLLFDYFKVKYQIEKGEPDIIICAEFTNDDISEFCIKTKKNYPNIRLIFITGENTRYKPFFDYNITFDKHLIKNIRIPLWNWEVFFNLSKRNQNLPILKFTDGIKLYKNLILKDSDLSNKKFCCFIASNNVTYRNNFVKLLSKYKQVDCAGRCLNNFNNKTVINKYSFQSQYKFCIAFENDVYPGYCTEKIMEAYISNCVPLYYGDPFVEEDFNSETFINCSKFKNMTECIQFIIRIDNDDSLYKSFLNKSIYSKYWQEIFDDHQLTFYKNLSDNIIHA